MTNYSTVNMAVELAVNLFEANGIVVDTPSIEQNVYFWYSHSDIADPEILAAAVLASVKPNATYDELLETRNIWFPENHFEIAAWEIEEAFKDAEWQ